MEAKDHVPSLYEAALTLIETDLEIRFRPTLRSNLTQSLQTLRYLDSLTKSELEKAVSRIAMVALNDVDHERLKLKIRDLIADNQHQLEICGLE